MPKRKKLFWRLVQSYLLITLLSLIIMTLLAMGLLRQVYLEQTKENLITKAKLIEKMIPAEISFKHADEIDSLCKEIGTIIETRITVILPNGSVIGDSEENYKHMDNHSDRPEIKIALSGMLGISTRYSYTMKKDFMYAAIPVVKDGEISCVLRTSVPVTSVAILLKKIYLNITIIGAVIALAAVIVSFIVSGWLNKPIKEMIQGVDHFTTGDLNFRIPVSTTDELRSLTEAMNGMAAQLDKRIRSIAEQRNELDAVLSGMVEAVFAVNKEGYIVEYNRSAQKLFNIDFKTARGRHIQEVIRNPHLQAFIMKTLSQHEFVDDEIILHNGEECVLQAHGTQILDAQNESSGAIIVLNDITHMKKLESVRRDFVANVSHELKTPITSIIGFVETLKDGAINDKKNRDQFLNIILKHGERLNGIIEDLLSLSRIEKDTENGKIDFETHDVCEILTNSISLCDHAAKDKEIIINLECNNILVKCNSSLLEQAIVNLIDNSIKYSDRESTVIVKAFQTDKEITIEVKDNGCGIPKEHVSRIFERFYRVDKGRSRDLGGTGLGLAIVKHIVIAHRGRVTVESTPGKGSIFSIILPSI